MAYFETLQGEKGKHSYWTNYLEYGNDHVIVVY